MMVEVLTQEVEKDSRQKQQSNSQASAFDIEDFIVGLYVLAKQAVVTLYDLAIQPARVIEEIKHGGREKRYLRPFTFLVLFSFIFVLVIRDALIYKLIWEQGETLVKEGIDYSNLILPYPDLSDLLKLPSFADIMLIGVPIILMVLVLSGLFGFLLMPEIGSNYKSFMQIGCYAVGFQSFMFFIFISTTIVIFNIVDSATFGAYISSPYLETSVVFLGIIWPGTIFSRMVLNYMPIESRRICRKWLSWLLTLTGATLICLITIASSSALANRLAQFDRDERYEVKPFIHTAIIPTLERERAQNLIHVMLTNNFNKHITISARKFTVTDLDGNKNIYEIQKHWPREGPIISIAPNESICLMGRRNALAINPSTKIKAIELDRIWPSGEKRPIIIGHKEKLL